MQAADQVGPKILFDLSQVEAGFPVRYLRCGLESKARVRHPEIPFAQERLGQIHNTIPGLATGETRDCYRCAIGGEGAFHIAESVGSKPDHISTKRTDPARAG